MLNQFLRIVPAVALIMLPLSGLAQTGDTARPTIGLVLSGGGARGVAHVGVVKVLDEMRIPVDYIAGTSMGAMVGSLYASGTSAAELERIFQDADWPVLLSDRPPRAQRSYRRKTDDFGFLVDFEVGVNKEGLIIPQGIMQGQNLTLELRRLLIPVANISDFDRLPIPFRTIATDLVNGQEVVLGSGDLPKAIRASMSAPGLLKPVRIDGRLLIDGGVTNNLPVGITRSMGADVLIVVDVGTLLAEEVDLDSALQIMKQMTTIMGRARTEEQKRLMTDEDVLIAPELGRISFQSFDQSMQAIRLGEVAARQSMDKLKRFSVSEQVYAAHRQSLQRARWEPPVIHQVVIENESQLSAKVLEARLSEQRGEALDLEQLNADIADIYGFDTFETVDYSIERHDAENLLVVRSSAKSWGPNYLRFGVNLEDDFDGNSSYNFAARLTKAEINARGGELRVDAVVGENPHITVEMYQPLDFASRWFVNPRVSYQRSNQGLFDSGNQIAEFLAEETQLSLGAGRKFGNWGELRLTLARAFADQDVRIGDPALGTGSGNVTSFTLGFGYDTIDRIAIPRFGTYAQAGWLGLREGFGADLTADIAQMVFLKPQTWGKNTVLHWWDLGSVSQSGETSLDAFELGGLFSLSGYGRDELQGDHRAMARLLYYRRLGDRAMPMVGTPIYVGASIEVGNVWQERADARFRNALAAGSVFVVFDTVLGPLYLAYGAAEGDRQSAYLFLGQTF
ncbi:MAG: patatin-like phospholipase family protein [Gammaproteobacteria bacterium]|nr:patatin-like phospholipase family protein [Gammaproteobacteria bacterium]